MKGLLGIDCIKISENQLSKAFQFLAFAGKKGVEGIGLFAGVKNASTFHVREVIIPEQHGYILEEGLMYAVGGEELHRINLWLYEKGYELIAQIHSHPKEAFHSEADDKCPIVDTLGGISMVVPDFARGLISLEDWAIYRLSNKKTWDLLSKPKVKSLFQII